ncbi:MAG: hypothetical protein MJY84_06470 [Bacteroidales bacterium]|nr:hypothetical protein [Bacteroidales bacterium]
MSSWSEESNCWRKMSVTKSSWRWSFWKRSMSSWSEERSCSLRKSGMNCSSKRSGKSCCSWKRNGTELMTPKNCFLTVMNYGLTKRLKMKNFCWRWKRMKTSMRRKSSWPVNIRKPVQPAVLMLRLRKARM